MKNLNTDGIRTALSLLVGQTLSALVLVGVVKLDAEQLAAVLLPLQTLITLAFYFIKPSAAI